MIAYKLFRVMKDGSISSLFINKRKRYEKNVWLIAEFIPTKGFAKRFGWHSTHSPYAPHLSMKGRVWFKVEIEDYDKIERPLSQGGTWYISKKLKILDEI